MWTVVALLLWLTAVRSGMRARCGPPAPRFQPRTKAHRMTHLMAIRVVLVRCRGRGRAGMTQSGVTRSAQGVAAPWAGVTCVDSMS